jgi:hypothetical protein
MAPIVSRLLTTLAVGVDDPRDRALFIRTHGGGGRSRKRIWRAAGSFRLLLTMLLIACWGSRASLAQSPISIFGNAVPSNAVEADYSAVTLGVKFWSSQAGSISAIRFYRGATSPSGYVARLYSAAGQRLGSVTLGSDTSQGPGWRTAVFAAPIKIAANTTYIAAYYTPNGRYADDYYGLQNGMPNRPLPNGPLNVPGSSVVGGNGVYYYGLGFPANTWEASNYYVDVLFTPAATAPPPPPPPPPAPPVLSLTFEPPNPSIPSTTPLGAPVATIIATWSNGQPFTGTISIANSTPAGVFAISNNNSLIIDPLGPGVSAAGGTVEQVTIVATQ